MQQLECEPPLSEEIRQDISCFVMLTSLWRYHLQVELVEKVAAITLEAWLALIRFKRSTVLDVIDLNIFPLILCHFPNDFLTFPSLKQRTLSSVGLLFVIS